MRTVRLSFQPAFEDDPSPLVTIYNPEIMIPPLSDQVARFGLQHSLNRKAITSGKLKGGRKPFTEMIQSYGFLVEVVDSNNPNPTPAEPV